MFSGTSNIFQNDVIFLSESRGFLIYCIFSPRHAPKQYSRINPLQQTHEKSAELYVTAHKWLESNGNEKSIAFLQILDSKGYLQRYAELESLDLQDEVVVKLSFIFHTTISRNAYS
jgi:hypothetical protein